MKITATLALLALAVTPVLVGAQTVTPAPLSSAAPASRTMRGPGPAMMPGHHQLSPQARATMKQLRGTQSALKAKMFGSLSAAHRAFVASVIGNLAISSKPNVKAAIAQIDAQLTTSEKTAIVNAHATAMKQMATLGKQLRGEMHAQWQTSNASPRPMAAQHHMRRMHKPRTPDAGAFLLQAARPHGSGMMMHGKREHRPM